MLLKKKVKAGILLYALLMLAVFSLLLQFYLHRQEAESQIAQLAKQEATAYIMAQMVLDQVGEDIQNRELTANQVTSQVEQKKSAETVNGEEPSKKEVQEEQPTRENPETNEKTVQTISKKKEKIKQIEDRGSIFFQQGQASYHVKNKQVSIVVEVRKGERYHYQFPVNGSLEGE